MQNLPEINGGEIDATDGSIVDSRLNEENKFENESSK